MVGWAMRHYPDRRCCTDTVRRAVEMMGDAVTEDLMAPLGLT